MKITEEMIQCCCKYGEKVYQGQIDKTTASNKINKETEMNSGSAKDYLMAFACMMKGEKYIRTINTKATIMYLNFIQVNHGNKQLKSALHALEEHVTYYCSLGHGNLRSIEKLAKEFKKTLQNE